MDNQALYASAKSIGIDQERQRCIAIMLQTISTRGNLQQALRAIQDGTDPRETDADGAAADALIARAQGRTPSTVSSHTPSGAGDDGDAIADAMARMTGSDFDPESGERLAYYEGAPR